MFVVLCCADVLGIVCGGVSQCPDVFIYLSGKKAKRFSFTRIKFDELVKRGWKQPPGT